VSVSEKIEFKFRMIRRFCKPIRFLLNMDTWGQVDHHSSHAQALIGRLHFQDFGSAFCAEKVGIESDLWRSIKVARNSGLRQRNSVEASDHPDLGL
jgi:hypothetical protein